MSAEAGRWPYTGSGQPGGPFSSRRTPVLRVERTELGLESGGETGLEGERLRAGWRSLGIHGQLEKGNSCQVRE